MGVLSPISFSVNALTSAAASLYAPLHCSCVMDAHLKNYGFAQLAGGVVSSIAAACFAGGSEAPKYSR